MLTCLVVFNMSVGASREMAVAGQVSEVHGRGRKLGSGSGENKDAEGGT